MQLELGFVELLEEPFVVHMRASSCVIRVSPRVYKTWDPISNLLLGGEGEGGEMGFEEQ